jgi:16S rRNA (guanine(527)-N(7))-methyltransferase RsmG
VDRERRAAGRDLDAAIRHFTGRSTRAEERQRFDAYLEQLLLWNRTHRLTGLDDPADIVRKLFIDSLLYLPLLPAARPIRVADVGSGPGIPGVPLRIVDAGISLTLLDSKRKAVSFLSTLRRTLGLDDVGVHQARAETYLVDRPEDKGVYRAVVIRAMALDRRLLASLRELLAEGGRIIASGPPGTQAQAETVEGATVVEVPYPKLGLRRTFLVYGASAKAPNRSTL